MRTTVIRRDALAVVVAAIAFASPASPLTGSASARQIRLDPVVKDCKLNGTTIRSGSRGRAGGIEYECTDGVACQVEGGRTTRKCSHAARLGVVRGGLQGLQILSLAPRG